MQIGAQLYTLRDYCRNLEDFAETLKKVADIGYRTVQVSGTCEYDPAWLKEQLDKTGLICPLTHYNTNRILSEPEATADAHAIFDCHYIGMGSLPGGTGGLAKIDEFIENVKKAGAVIAAKGGYVMYHNHHFEFGHDETGMTYLEKLAQSVPAELMGFTLDTYWVQVGGGSPVEWIEKLSGRLPCIHLKDLAIVDKEQRMAAVGDGNINFAAVVEAAEKAGTKYAFVEQDNCYGEDPFACMKRSYEHLRSLGLK